MISIGSDIQHVEKLGKGDLLIDRPEFKRLAPFADRPIVSVGYVGSEMMNNILMTKDYFQNITASITAVLPEKMDPELRKEIEKDIAAVEQSVTEYLPEAGVVLGIGWSTAQGYEGRKFNWSRNNVIVGDEPLSILSYVRGDPIWALTARERRTGGELKLINSLLSMMEKYTFNAYGANLKGEELKDYQNSRKDIDPIWKRFKQANEDHLAAIIGTGEGAIVLDAKSETNHWFDLTPTETPLPLPELAMLMEISNRDGFIRGCQEYMGVYMDFLAFLSKSDPGVFPPEFTFPKPERKDLGDAGELYIYAAPEEWGLNDQIALTLGLGTDVALITSSPAQAEAILKKTLPQSAYAASAQDEPAAMVAEFHWAELVAAVGPWVEYGVAMSTADYDDDQREEITSQVTTAIELLQCFRGYQSVTRVDGDVQVTEYEAIFQDLAE